MVSINFDKMSIPVISDEKAYNGNYYIPGKEGKFFDHLTDYYYNSSIHASIINNLHRRLQVGYETDPIYYKISLDYLIYGGWSLQVLWNINHDKIVEMYHMEYSKVRAGLQDEDGNISLFYYSNDWKKYNNRKVTILAPYNESTLTDDNQSFYYRRYSPDFVVYPKPYYYSGLRWIQTDIELEKYYSSLVQNNFVANTILSINSFMDEDKQRDFEKSLRKSFTGGENAGTLIVMYNENPDNKPELVKFNNDADDTKYQWISEKVIENISIAHNLPSALLGLSVPGKLGNATDLPVFEEIYTKFVVQPIKDDITTEYIKLKSKLIQK